MFFCFTVTFQYIQLKIVKKCLSSVIIWPKTCHAAMTTCLLRYMPMSINAYSCLNPIERGWLVVAVFGALCRRDRRGQEGDAAASTGQGDRRRRQGPHRRAGRHTRRQAGRSETKTAEKIIRKKILEKKSENKIMKKNYVNLYSK